MRGIHRHTRRISIRHSDGERFERLRISTLRLPDLVQEKDAIMPKRDAVMPASRHALYEAHRYSAAIRSGDLLFVSGQVGSREDGSPEPDFEAQARCV